MLMLLEGAHLDLDADKTETHFKHSAGDEGQRVQLIATASFDPDVAAASDVVDCYVLAGIKIPPAGPIEGFRIRWSLEQDLGHYSRFYGGYEAPPFLQGKYLAPTSSDAHKIDSCGSCGGRRMRPANPT